MDWTLVDRQRNSPEVVGTAVFEQENFVFLLLCCHTASPPVLGLVLFCSISFFSSLIGAGAVKMTVPYSPPSVGSRGYTWTSFHSGVWFVIPIRPLGHFWHSSYPINLLTLASSLRSRSSSPTCEAHVSDGGQVGVSSVTDYDALDYGSGRYGELVSQSEQETSMVDLMSSMEKFNPTQALCANIEAPIDISVRKALGDIQADCS